MLLSWLGRGKPYTLQPTSPDAYETLPEPDADLGHAKRKHRSPTTSLIASQHDVGTKRARSHSTGNVSDTSLDVSQHIKPSMADDRVEKEDDKNGSKPSNASAPVQLERETEKSSSVPETLVQQNRFWTWLGYSSKAEQNPAEAVPSTPTQTIEHTPTDTKTNTAPTDAVTSTARTETDVTRTDVAGTTVAPTPSSSASWRSFFFTTAHAVESKDSKDVSIDASPLDEARPPQLDRQRQEEKEEKGVGAAEPPTSDEQSEPQTLSPTPPTMQNKVIPSFDSQFSVASDIPSTTFLGRALNAINSIFVTDQHAAGARFIESVQANPESLASKRIVVVGVHGWFPAKLVRSMIGEPTGTSTKFCKQMALGVKHYLSRHNIDLPDECTTSIPLLYEGKVEERVAVMYTSLVGNDMWMKALRSADAIFWATHSQGTPVSTILLHKLVEEGHIQPDRQPTCFLAMAGIAHGPFPALKDSFFVRYFEADAARELFEFMDPEKDVSQKFRQSLAHILRAGVKTVLVGSMQDQVVPLYSAIMSGITHPHILRAIYIDGHIYSKDDFLINLISFALRLRNAGLSDHGLLNHISEVLAGNLYALEGGHSTIYEERQVYVMAAQYLFETPPLGHRTLSQPTAPAMVASDNNKRAHAVEAEMDAFQAKVRLNPYFLPWAMRGIFDDPRVLNDAVFCRELDRLRGLFEDWSPTSAKLREIKFRLEPLKARL